MNKWRRHIVTGSVAMALGIASMVPGLALAGSNSYGNQDTGTNSSQPMDSSSSSSGHMSPGSDANSGGTMNSGESAGSNGKMNSGGSMGYGDKMNSGGSMSQGMSQGGTSMSRDTVEAVQRALNKAGYDLSVDGIQGPKTAAALKKYQQSHGLQPSGKVTPQTMQKLGVSP